MKVFDFDNTLYRGESAIDFALYLMKKNKKVILWIPKILFGLIRYELCLISRDEIINQTNDFMKVIISSKKEVEDMAAEFWLKKQNRLNLELIKKIAADDVIITAGPSFLIDKIKDKLVTKNIICSEINLQTKNVEYLNFGDNKVKFYREKYGDKIIDCFYTDSYNDKAMMDISKEVYLVKRHGLKQLK